jgi:hypothetical protein
MAHRPSAAFLEFIFSCLLSLSSLAVSAAVDAHGHAFHAQGRSRGAPSPARRVYRRQSADQIAARALGAAQTQGTSGGGTVAHVRVDVGSIGRSEWKKVARIEGLPRSGVFELKARETALPT